MESSQLPSQELRETDKEVVEEEEEDPLQKQLKKLEQEWSFFKQSKSNPLQNTHHYSTVTEDFQLLTENSPRDPMSSLQQQRRLSPEGYFWNWRQNDKAAVEMLKEGWDSIESSKLKGKRLFEDLSTEEEEDDDDDDDDICSECFNLGQESEEGLVFSWGENENAVLDCCYCNSSSSSSECEEMVERDVVKETETAVLMKLRNDGIGHQKIWWGVVIALLGLIFAVYLVSRKFNGGYVEDVTLAPT